MRETHAEGQSAEEARKSDPAMWRRAAREGEAIEGGIRLVRRARRRPAVAPWSAARSRAHRRHRGRHRRRAGWRRPRGAGGHQGGRARDVTTPAGVGLLRRLAEGMEDETRSKQEEGAHTQIAKDQPGHHADEALNRMKTFRFEVSQECSVQADKEVIGADARGARHPTGPDRHTPAGAAARAGRQAGRAATAGHPYEEMVKKHQPQAAELLGQAEGGAGGRPRPRGRALAPPLPTQRS